MKRLIGRWVAPYFSPALEFRVRLFNILAVTGFTASLVMALLGVINQIGYADIVVNLVAACLSVLLLRHARRTGRYQVCYMITIFAIFLILFPILFFNSGGYLGGMPSFFIFAVAFTIFMLEGWRAIAFSLLELTVYTAICLAAYVHPEWVRWFGTDAAVLTDILVSCLMVCVALGTAMFLHFRLYNQQQRKLDEQNRLLEDANKLKTELFANVSHEMKTPLTIISVHIQRAETLFEMARGGDEAKIRESFALAQDEIMRMSRLVNSALKLASMQESGGGRAPIDVGAVLRTGAVTYHTLLDRQGNTLTFDIPDDLPQAICSADEVVQIISNLLANANEHTRNGTICLRVSSDGRVLIVAVEDNGSGIPPALLPRVFERGVTGGDGSGLGLYICRELVRSHGGEITAQSEYGAGTRVAFTLPIREEVATDA